VLEKTRRQFGNGRLFILLTTLLFSVLSVLGLSGSSLRVLSDTNTTESHETQIGRVRPIRSDEYLVWSPIKLGQANAGFPEERFFGLESVNLGSSWRHQIPFPNLGQAIFSPINLPLFLPWRTIGFAAFWWLPYWAALLGVFLWLRALGLRSIFASSGAILSVISPVRFWWSGWNLIGIAHASLGCAAVLQLTDGKKGRGKRALLICSGVWAFAGLPWFYQPWAIAAALCLGLPTITALVSRYFSIRRERADLVSPRFPMRDLLLIVFATISSWALFLWHERSYFAALASTEYPGQRRVVGGGLSIGHVFSSMFSADLSGRVGDTLRNTNLSEFSMGWSILFLLAVCFLAVQRPPLRRSDSSLLLNPHVFMIGAYIAMFWAFVTIPLTIAKLTPLGLVQPVRLAPYIGTMGACGFVAALSVRCEQNDNPPWTWKQVLGASSFVLFFFGWATSDIRLNFVLVSWRSVMIGVFFCIAPILLCAFNRPRIAVVLASCAALVAVANINPLVRDFGSLKDSPISEAVRKGSNEAERPVWAVDDLYLVPIVNFQGIDSLSSFNDPVGEKGWGTLDPSGEASFNWNRFAYILFDWNEEAKEPKIVSSAPDVIMVSASPCDRQLKQLGVSHIISSKELNQDCLSHRGHYLWMGASRYLYYVEDAQ